MLYMYGVSNKGKDLQINEDALLIRELKPEGATENADYLIMIVTDGNGSESRGISSGAIVTNIIYDYIVKTMKPTSSIVELQALSEQAIFTASRTMLAINGLEEKYRTMYASAEVLIVSKASNEYSLVSVGNTETIFYRNGNLIRLNDLHTEAYDLLMKNEIQESEYYNNPKRAILTSAIGAFNKYKIFSTTGRFAPNDVVFLMTDGIPFHMNLEEVLRYIANEKNVPTALQKAIDLGNSRGGHDNMTIGLLSIEN